MISQIRNSLIVKLFWGLMGFYLLNISADTADPNPEHIPEDLSINDQESIVEIIVEKVLGFEDAIKEYDDHDTHDFEKKKNLKVELVVSQSRTKDNSFPFHYRKQERFPFLQYQPRNGFTRLVNPPPQV